MKTWQKFLFVAVLVIFVSASITIALISISRPPYKYSEEEAIGGDESLSGWVFSGFNGNASTVTLNIDFVRDKNGNDPDESEPVLGIGKYAVNADEYVTELRIGKTVRFIEETAFFNLKSLQKITVDPENEWFRDIDGVLFTKDGKELILYPLCYGRVPGSGEDGFDYPAEYTVPDGVERINTFAFLKNEHLRDLTLPDSLREIGDMTFFGCSRLGAYEYDSGTDSLVGKGFELPDGIEKIGSDAFSKCTSIAPTIFIPSSVTEIKHHAFFSCNGLKSVLMGAENEDSVTLGEAWLKNNVKNAEFGASRSDTNGQIEEYKAEKLDSLREEAKKNG